MATFALIDAGHDFVSDYSGEQTDESASRQRYESRGQCYEEYDYLLNDKMSYQWHDCEPHTSSRAQAYVEEVTPAHNTQANWRWIETC